ncbi:hypothetical protein D9619_010923 [Psilocybe cf. subviscida]|uniref:Flavin reductase like domain-containing protein n=1 Tax=Psilocybe cf. subviscida TaxID=2480587 RepID=A0A8H5B8Y4_9AGAR|nr:hypothetical protein D9619_010923 [Psilocybe cf. subviscida]
MSANLPPFQPSEFRYTESPNPNWTYGQRIESTEQGREWAEGEKQGWTVIDTSKADKRQLYAVMIAGIVPRPVAFVSSLSADGIGNLAPFSWFNQVTSNPPIISISVVNYATVAKDTVRNIRATNGFTVNIISEPWVDQANIGTVDAPYEVNEWPISGLTKAPSIHVKAPRVKESAFSMECELYQAIEIKNPETGAVASTLVLGLVKFIHMRNDVIDAEKGTPDPGKLRAIARLGGITYGKVTEGFILPRPSWKDVGEDIKSALGAALEEDSAKST